ELEEFQAAQEILLEAAQAAQDIGSRRMLWQINYYLGEFERQQGNLDKAIGYFYEAQEIISYIVGTIDQPEMKNLFLARSDVKNLHEIIESNSVSK
ncbi:MAG: hypothetical protein ABFS17_11130, partial [Chloroflexota bacterium]